MERAKATERLNELLERVLSGGFYVDHVRKIYVFGSYARGALEVGDIDLDVEYDPSEELKRRIRRDFFAHRDHHLDFLKELRGTRRGFQIQFNEASRLASEEGFELIPIFACGDTLEEAVARLNLINEDPDARSAPREAVIPQIEGMEKLTTRPERMRLNALVDHGAVTVTRVELKEQTPQHSETKWRIDHSWAVGNPKRRAAYAAAAWLEENGAGDLWAGLSGRAPLHDDGYEHCVYFGLGAIERAVDALCSGARLCLCVFNETRKTMPLLAIALSSRLSSDQLWDIERDLERASSG